MTSFIFFRTKFSVPGCQGLAKSEHDLLAGPMIFPNTFHHASRQILAERVIGSLLKVCFAEQKKLSLKKKNWIFNLKKRAAKKTSEKSLFFEESQNPQIGIDISYLQSQSSLTVCFLGEGELRSTPLRPIHPNPPQPPPHTWDSIDISIRP